LLLLFSCPHHLHSCGDDHGDGSGRHCCYFSFLFKIFLVL